MDDDAPVEIELKLLASEDALDRLGRHPTVRHLAIGRAATRHLHSIYWDTPSQALHAAGLLLRTRRIGRHWVQTLKQENVDGRSGGLERRGEWELPIAGEAPEPRALADTPLAEVLEAQGADVRLVPLFATDFRRTTRQLKTRAGDEIELALDRGQVTGAAGKAPICEAELELKRGRPVALFELARELARDLPLKVGRDAKSVRGFRLGEAAPPTPMRANGVSLDPAMTAADAFAAVARQCLDQLHGNETPVIDASANGPGDGEAVHQMRVGLRRLRAAISLFGPAVRTEQTQAIRAEAKWLAGELGEARDLDVLLAQGVSEVRAALPGEDGLWALSEDLDAARGDAYGRAVAAVSDARFTDLLLATGAWIEGRGYLGSAEALERPVADFANDLLHRRHRKLMRAAADLGALDEPERHRLRIRVKKQRYAAEFFRSLYAERRAARYVKGLARLQEALGELNDAVTARRVLKDRIDHLERAGSNRVGELRHAAGLVVGWQAREAGRRWRKLVEEWGDQRRLRRFWPKPESEEANP